MIKHRTTSRKAWRWATVATVVAASAAATIGVSTAATSPAATVAFTKVYCDSPGTDTRTNASLNGEWFQLTNKDQQDNQPHRLVRAGHREPRVPAERLAGGREVAGRAHRPGNGEQTGRPSLLGSGSYIWNNTGDTATLRDNSGKTVHSCKWGRGTGWTTCGAVLTQTARPPLPATTRPTTPPVEPTTPATPGTPGDGDDGGANGGGGGDNAV